MNMQVQEMRVLESEVFSSPQCETQKLGFRREFTHIWGHIHFKKKSRGVGPRWDEWLSHNIQEYQRHMAVCQNLVPLVNIKIAGKWMFIPLKIVLIGIDPYPYQFSFPTWTSWRRCTGSAAPSRHLLLASAWSHQGPVSLTPGVRPRVLGATCYTATELKHLKPLGGAHDAGLNSWHCSEFCSNELID